jgi:hypothetical protein
MRFGGSFLLLAFFNLIVATIMGNCVATTTATTTTISS